MAKREHDPNNDWLLRIVTPLAYILGVGGPIVMITLGIMGKLPS